MSWQTQLKGDSLSWLLESDDRRVRYFSLRNLVVAAAVASIGLAACRPATIPGPSAATTRTIQEPAATAPPSQTAATQIDSSEARQRLIDFMVDYIVENEIRAMIDLIQSEDIPMIEQPPQQFIIIHSPLVRPREGDDSSLMGALDTENALQVWIFEDGALATAEDGQAAILGYQVFIRDAPQMPSIFTWGYNEFGILSISDDGLQAEVYLEATCGSACAHGIVLELQRSQDGAWVQSGIRGIWGA